MQKIVIISTFASSHFLKYWIENTIQIINPDKIIISEGLHKNGPENKGHIDSNFREKWCYENTNAGFDWQDTVDICNQFGDLIQLSIIDYHSDNAVDSFKQAISNFGDCKINVGDILICSEPDAFFHENDIEIISEALHNLEIGSGYQLLWKDFLETQYYCEYINEIQPKWRRFAYRFDTLDNYLNAMGDGFMTQQYPQLKKLQNIIQFHYPWFVFDKWKELRYELIYRSDPKYWQDFEKGLQEIRKFNDGTNGGTHFFSLPEKILIRPSRQDEGRWAQFIDIQHPKHIKNHPNFVK